MDMSRSIQEFDIKYFIKLRSSLDGQQSFLTWSGSIYAWIPGERRKKLFNMLGMSVSRCIPVDGESWDFTSRELTYYLDPETGKILNRWENPWTGETLTVVHVANNPVQGRLKGQFPAEVNDDMTTFWFDLFPHYPNPLADDPKFAQYSPQEIYQATELFKLTVPTEDLQNPDLNSVSKLFLSWDRIGPWLPWMKMGDRPGQLIYSGRGVKVNDFTELPELLQNEINTRVPVYKNAPQPPLDEEADMTSWTYFKKHFQAYLSGERFPIVERG
jgi:hypothetical protein